MIAMITLYITGYTTMITMCITGYVLSLVMSTRSAQFSPTACAHCTVT